MKLFVSPFFVNGFQLRGQNKFVPLRIAYSHLYESQPGSDRYRCGPLLLFKGKFETTNTCV